MNNVFFPRVLVVSHNVFSTTSNMGKTMATFFNSWDNENLAQLYFHSELPNDHTCKRFFRITDFDMLESVFKFESPGEVLDIGDIKLNTVSTRVDRGLKADIYQYGKKKDPFMVFSRNLLWSTNKWDTKKLSKWIDDFNPEVVFYAAGDYSFSIKVALKICKERAIPMVVYFGDEYYFLDTHRYFFSNWLNKKIFKKSFQNLFSYLNTFITASNKMQRKYSDAFKKQGYAIMTSTKIAKSFIFPKETGCLKVSYIGNLGLDRWKPLVEIGRSLKKEGLILDVYSGEKRENVVSLLNEDNGINFQGAIPASKVEEVIKASTIIIHVEAMDEINRQRTRYSMSTKIAESLGSGVCLFAYGPDDVSSIEYLTENEAACVVTTKEDLQVKLVEIIYSEELRKKYINSALKLASERHNFETNTQLFLKIITDAHEDWKRG